ncbi:SPBC3B9.04 [Scenedesmus sp. PABB004]|nr:SPBC3B9.04 [Scenedesmus sp. PABB004]
MQAPAAAPCGRPAPPTRAPAQRGEAAAAAAAAGGSGRRRALLAAAAAALQQQLAGRSAAAATCAAAGASAPQRLWVLPPRGCLALGDVGADYDGYAATYDALDGGAASAALGFPGLRRALLAQASGDALEVAVGTGLNLPLWDWASLASLTALDLSPGMLDAAAARAAAVQPGAGGVPVRLVQGDAAALPFDDGSFDAVVDTFSLCVMERPQAALAEFARVLRPGGRLLLLEHTRSDSPLLGAYQGATRGLVAPISKGCDWAQDVPGMVAALPGVAVTSQQRHLAGTLVSISAQRL